jgi:acyl dehydratase
MIGKTIDLIKLGDSASQVKTITERDIELFGEITNDYNPAHFDSEYAKGTMFKQKISHGMLVGSLFSKIFGMDLPGQGSIYLTQSLRFRRPVYFEDVITASVKVVDINLMKNRVKFECTATNQNDVVVVLGEAEIMPPEKKSN